MTTIMPNADSTATVDNAVPSLESIASKMAAMRESTVRNQLRTTEQTETGDTESLWHPKSQKLLQPTPIPSTTQPRTLPQKLNRLKNLQNR